MMMKTFILFSVGALCAIVLTTLASTGIGALTAFVLFFPCLFGLLEFEKDIRKEQEHVETSRKTNTHG